MNEQEQNSLNVSMKKDLWKLFRSGDVCVVRHEGVQMRGFVSAVIRLSNGINLIRVCNAANIAMGLFSPEEVEACYEHELYRRENQYQSLLERLEPKGQSTLTF